MQCNEKIGQARFVIIIIIIDTVEPPNDGQVGALTLVHCSEGVLYWGVL